MLDVNAIRKALGFAAGYVGLRDGTVNAEQTRQVPKRPI